MGPRSRADDDGNGKKSANKNGKGDDRHHNVDDDGGGDDDVVDANDTNASLDRITHMTDDEYLDFIGNYKPGSIREIKLTNFLSYKSVVIHPGPRCVPVLCVFVLPPVRLAPVTFGSLFR
jgi:hypothetical protein